jgi:hypothetical protein
MKHLLKKVTGSKQSQSKREAMWAAVSSPVCQDPTSHHYLLDEELQDLIFALLCFILLWSHFFFPCQNSSLLEWNFYSCHCILEVCNLFVILHGLTAQSWPCTWEKTLNLDFLTSLELLRLWGLQEKDKIYFWLWDVHESLAPGAECYGLNMKYPPQAHVSNAGLLASGTTLRGVGNFGRWGIVGGRRSLGGMSLKVIAHCSFFPLPASCLPWSE